MKERCYLAVDLGAESGRVMAGLWNGTSLRVEELHRFPNGPVDVRGTLRWDLLRLWSEILTGLGVAHKKYGDAIDSIGVDGWGLDYVLMSKSDEMLGLPFCYRDRRTEGLVEEICSLVGKDEIFARTGTQFMEINTLCQWLIHFRRSPEIFAAADCLLMIPDWINWALSGKKAVEFTNATTTQFYDPEKRGWSLDLLSRLGLPSGILPSLISPGTDLGKLLGEVREKTGLGPIRVIAPATHDTGSAVVGVPASRSEGRGPNWAYISSGTWSLVGVEIEAPLLSRRAMELNFTNEGGIDRTFRLLKNVMGLWLLQKLRARLDEAGSHHAYGDLVGLAAAAEPFRSLIDPDDHSFLNPRDMVQAIQTFCTMTNQPVPDTASRLARCILESLALKYSVVLDSIEELTGTKIETVHIVSGGSRNQLLNSFTASACNRPVIAGPVEATAIGNILVQARACGALGTGQIHEVVRNSCDLHIFEPQPSESASWENARGKFREFLDWWYRV